MNIKKEVIEKETGISVEKVLEDLKQAAKKQGGGTVSHKINNLEFIYFSEMANGQKNILTVGTEYNGTFTTLTIV